MRPGDGLGFGSEGLGFALAVFVEFGPPPLAALSDACHVTSMA
jgi:hypothetical protein